MSYCGSLNAISLPLASLLNQVSSCYQHQVGQGCTGLLPTSLRPARSSTPTIAESQHASGATIPGPICRSARCSVIVCRMMGHTIFCAQGTRVKMKLFVSQLVDCSSATSKPATSQLLLLLGKLAYEGCPHMGTLTPWFGISPCLDDLQLT